MYSRQYFVELFSELDTDELLDRLATADLTDEANDAIHSVLRERGISNKELGSHILKAKKSQFRSTSPTKECDFCGKSTLFSVIRNEGQKFCSKNCLRNARLMEAAVDISEQEILNRAVEIKNGPCPSCRGRESEIEIRKSYWVWSAVFFTRWGTSPKICCKKCGVQSNLISIGSCLFFGWWGIPWGLFITPAQIISNVAAMFRRIDHTKPSLELLQTAKLQLAETLLGQQPNVPSKALHPTPQTARRG